MKALVTGGAGFIGSNICTELIRSGAKVIVLDDLSSGYEQNLKHCNGIEFLEGDIRDADLVKSAVKGCDVVFHLAASVGNKRSIDYPEIDTDINVNGTLRVLEAARYEGVRKVVISSSAGIYGELKTVPIEESHAIEPLTPYGVSKLYAEKMALAFAYTYGLEAICLRYFNVYGQHQRYDAYGNVIPIFVFKALNGEAITIFGDGQQTRDFVHVDDVVQANINAAMNHGVSGAFNIASGTQTRIIDLANAVVEGVGRPIEIQYASKRAGDVEHSLADISAAHQSFSYAPQISIESGLKGYIEWARNEVNLKK